MKSRRRRFDYGIARWLDLFGRLFMRIASKFMLAGLGCEGAARRIRLPWQIAEAQRRRRENEDRARREGFIKSEEVE